jgi:hypothetical protein
MVNFIKHLIIIWKKLGYKVKKRPPAVPGVCGWGAVKPQVRDLYS